MKRLMFITGFLFLFLYNLSLNAEIVKINKANGGANGYYSVSETHDTNVFSEDVHTLNCQDPGMSPCVWTNPPTVSKLTGYAERQIQNGYLEGSYEQFLDSVRHVVNWTATNVYNSNINETIYNGI